MALWSLIDDPDYTLTSHSGGNIGLEPAIYYCRVSTHTVASRGKSLKWRMIIYSSSMCVCLCIYAGSYECARGNAPCVCGLTICARRYICAWLAVRVGLDGLPSRTACWEILVGVELMLWARLIS